MKGLLQYAPVQNVARAVSNWVDLQWSLLIHQLQKVAPRAHGRLLDVGCGSKPYEGIFRPFVAEYVGLEYGETFEQTHAASKETRADFFYDGETFPFGDESFDTVISIQVLEHTPHPQRVLDEIARVARGNGTIIISAPFSFRLHEEPNDFFRYTPHGMKVLFDRAGITVDEVWPAGDIWSVLGHKLNSHLAFTVARAGGMAQAVGKLEHENERPGTLRYWSLPLVLPTMVVVSAASRVLDRLAPDGSETLSNLVIGHRRER